MRRNGDLGSKIFNLCTCSEYRQSTLQKEKITFATRPHIYSYEKETQTSLLFCIFRVNRRHPPLSGSILYFWYEMWGGESWLAAADELTWWCRRCEKSGFGTLGEGVKTRLGGAARNAPSATFTPPPAPSNLTFKDNLPCGRHKPSIVKNPNNFWETIKCSK